MKTTVGRHICVAASWAAEIDSNQHLYVITNNEHIYIYIYMISFLVAGWVQTYIAKVRIYNLQDIHAGQT